MSPEHAALGRAPRPFYGELAGWRVAGAVGEKHKFSAVPVGPRADCSCGHGPLSGGTLSSATNVPAFTSPTPEILGTLFVPRPRAAWREGIQMLGEPTAHASVLARHRARRLRGWEGCAHGRRAGVSAPRKDSELAPLLASLLSAQGVLTPVKKRLSPEEQTQP